MKAWYLLGLLLICNGCLQEELSPENYDFRGSWDSRKYAIQIFSNGSGTLDIATAAGAKGTFGSKATG